MGGMFQGENNRDGTFRGNIPVTVFITMFLDFKRAFDALNRHILLDKLCHYGMRGVAFSWFKSYVQDRKQYVDINGTKSLKYDAELRDINIQCIHTLLHIYI